jgi:hypothetical protein
MHTDCSFSVAWSLVHIETYFETGVLAGISLAIILQLKNAIEK